MYVFAIRRINIKMVIVLPNDQEIEHSPHCNTSGFVTEKLILQGKRIFSTDNAGTIGYVLGKIVKLNNTSVYIQKLTHMNQTPKCKVQNIKF